VDKIKVLLVDDHPVVREGLRTMLSIASDIDVVAEAGDGLEAIDKVSEYQPHVVLMDLRMPNLDGLEATRYIKNHSPSTSVIVLTMYDSDACIVDAARAGADGYLLKDASRELLINTIRAVSSGGTLIKTHSLRETMLSLSETTGEVKEKLAITTTSDKLTRREHDVLRLLVQGRTNRAIAQALFISEDTAKKHVQSIILKLGVSDRTQAAVEAVRTGLVEPFPSQKA